MRKLTPLPCRREVCRWDRGAPDRPSSPSLVSPPRISYVPMLPTLLQTAATQGKAQGWIQPQPCRCYCLCQPCPLLTKSLQLSLVLSCSPSFPALPSPGIEASGCQGEQRVGLGWEGKQSPGTTMELLVRAPPAPVNNHRHSAAFIQGKCHKMQQAVFAKLHPPPCAPGSGWEEINIPGSSAGLVACPTSPVPSAGLPSPLKLPHIPAGSVPARGKPCQP